MDSSGERGLLGVAFDPAFAINQFVYMYYTVPGDVALYRPSTAQWWVRHQFTVAWGVPSDVPVPGDYNGDGLTDVAVYRPSTGQWWVRNRFTVQWGGPGDVPLPGDYNGDCDVAVFRPSTDNGSCKTSSSSNGGGWVMCRCPRTTTTTG